MKNFISKWMIVGLFSLLFVMLSSCKSGIDNMYFSDASESTLDEFYHQYQTYLNGTQAYIRQHYWSDHMFLTGLDDMPSDFSLLTLKESYTKEETKRYDPYLNQTMLHQNSQLNLMFLYENQFILNKDQYDSCEENKVCDVDGLYFSVDGNNIYKSTEVIDEVSSKKNTYFYETTEDNKVHFIQTKAFHSLDNMNSSYTHIEYHEDDYEMTITKVSQLYYFYYFDMKTGNRLNYVNDASTEVSYIDYYDDHQEVYYQVTYSNHEITQFKYYQYLNGHVKFSVLNPYHYMIGLNHVEGWDTIKKDVDGPLSARLYQLYQNDMLIDDELLSSFNEKNGDLVMHVDARSLSDAELADVISLHAYGLESGISIDTFDTLILDLQSLYQDVMTSYPIQENLDHITSWMTSSQEDPFIPIYQK